MTLRTTLLFLVTTLFLVGCINTTKKEVNRFVSLDKQHYSNNLTIRDDSFETMAEINTKEGFKEKRGLVGIVWDDSFVRAYIDKTTGLTVYQVYDIIYYSHEWAYYHTVNYKMKGQLKTQKLSVINREVTDCSSNAFIGCSFREDTTWTLSSDDVAHIAEVYNPNFPQSLQYRLKAKSGDDETRVIAGAEVVALIEAVENYKKRKNLP